MVNVSKNLKKKNHLRLKKIMYGFVRVKSKYDSNSEKKTGVSF